MDQRVAEDLPVNPEMAEQPVNEASLRTSAMKFLAWAHHRGLLSTDAYYPGEGYEPPVLANATDAAVSLLRAKLIRAVGINASVPEIVVFLQRAVPGVRQVLTLPTACDGIQLKYHQGHPDPVTPSAVGQAANPCAVHQAQAGGEFYTCGSSISVGNAAAAGTLGCLVRDAAGDLYGLSNNHVSGGCNYAPGGLPILAPGVMDVSPNMPYPFTIGTHQRQLPMNMGDPTTVDTLINQDASIFKIVAADRISSMQQNSYDTPAASMPLMGGMHVKKVGRSSGFTEGVVLGEMVGAHRVNYQAPEHAFSGPVYFDRMFAVVGKADRFSEPGDSGSLVVHEAPDGIDYAVGIIVAGYTDNRAPGNIVSLIMPIEPILVSFNVTLVAGHNV